jgi:hypothetical protein
MSMSAFILSAVIGIIVIALFHRVILVMIMSCVYIGIIAVIIFFIAEAIR